MAVYATLVLSFSRKLLKLKHLPKMIPDNLTNQNLFSFQLDPVALYSSFHRPVLDTMDTVIIHCFQYSFSIFDVSQIVK